ncbi:HU family DNA-binding protein [Metabacillus niabensis]|uniref:HU family DNA-binding protein n=1 Tax=Metabacillus niabensis TaxID=324854 RepID=UPI0039A39D36
MKKTDLIKLVSKKTLISKKDITKVVDSIFNTIQDALKNGERVQIHGKGTFEVRHRTARKGRNPRNGKEIIIEARNYPAFSAGKEWKEAIK